MSTSLHRFIGAQFGGNYEAQNKSVDILTTKTLVIPHNFNRLGANFANYGSNDVYVWPGELPAGAKGFLVAANGGILTLNARDDLVLVGYDWYATTLTTPASLLVVEIIEYNQGVA